MKKIIPILCLIVMLPSILFSQLKTNPEFKKFVSDFNDFQDAVVAKNYNRIANMISYNIMIRSPLVDDDFYDNPPNTFEYFSNKDKQIKSFPKTAEGFKKGGYVVLFGDNDEICGYFPRDFDLLKLTKYKDVAVDNENYCLKYSIYANWENTASSNVDGVFTTISKLWGVQTYPYMYSLTLTYYANGVDAGATSTIHYFFARKSGNREKYKLIWVYAVE